jgi:beta-glucosidase
MRKALITLLVTACAAPLLAAPTQPKLGARTKTIATVNGLRFNDLNANGRLDTYEDWRVPAPKRTADLVARVTFAEKARMMLIATNNPDCDGSISARGRDLIDTQKMTRFIRRTKANSIAPDCSVKPQVVALRGGYAQEQASARRWSGSRLERDDTFSETEQKSTPGSPKSPHASPKSGTRARPPATLPCAWPTGSPRG